MEGRRRLAAAASVLAVLSAAASTAQGGPDEPGGYATTGVILRTRPGVRPTVQPAAAGDRITLRTALPRAGAAKATGPVAEAMERWRVASIRPLFEGGFANEALARRIGLDRYYRASTPQGTDTPAMAADLRRFGDLIERVDVDVLGGVALVPNDTDFNKQWGLRNVGQVVDGVAGVPGVDINIMPGWNITVGDPDLILAVLDAGMSPHVEIAARMIPGKNVAADPDNDDTSDVCISHGTHVAGIAAATGNNSQGIAGVDWSCMIMPVKVLTSCTGPESYVAEGIVWATDHGADVINMSLQYTTGSTVLHDAVIYGYESGVIMIAAAGNKNLTQMAYPAEWPETIAVGAIDNVGARWYEAPAVGSNMGLELDVMAPGVDVWSLSGTTQYKYLTGTSMATPHVSGTVCLLQAIHPDITSDQVMQIIEHTSVDLGEAGFDVETGHGLLNSFSMIAEVAGVDPTLGDLDNDGEVNVTDLLLVLGTWGPCPEPCSPSCAADVDGSCEVGVGDLLIVLADWSSP